MENSSSRAFRGRVDVDIRDSEPDWTPFLQPKAPDDAPNILMIVWDDVGYGAMDIHGGPIETPTMGRVAMLGSRALYHDGFLASTVHPPMSGCRHFDQDVWELDNLASDRAQARNVASEHPDLVERLKGLWLYYVGVYKGLPIDDRTALEIGLSPRPQPSAPRDRYVYYPGTAQVPYAAAVNLAHRSFGIAAGVVIDTPDAEGVLLAFGGVRGGVSLYVQDRRPHFVHNWLGEKVQKVSSEADITTGRHLFTAGFQKTGDDSSFSALGILTLLIDTEPVGSLEIMTQPGAFSLSEGLSVGRDSGSPVTPEPS